MAGEGELPGAPEEPESPGRQVGQAPKSEPAPLPPVVSFADAAKGEPPPDVNTDEHEEHHCTKAKPRKTCLFEFSNTEAIKEKVQNAKMKENQYDVMDAYHETGLFQAIAKHPYFENTTLSVIVINALWISIDTDGNTAETMNEADAIYVVMDTLFFVYFSIEVIIRFIAFKRKRDCLKDGWFKFDMTLVLLYAFDPFTIALIAKAQGGGGLDLPTAVLRLFRLARLSRLVRMLRSLPELMIMIKGMVTATTSVGYTLGLLIIITYVFAIALRNLVPKALDTVEECEEKWPVAEGCIETVYFSTVPEAMHNLIIFGTFLDALSDFMWGVKEQSAPCLILCWMYISLASLTVMNMLIGVLCEVISAVAVEEKESMMVDKVHEKLGSMMSDLDKNKDGTLSWDEFQSILTLPGALATLESVNVDAASMVDMAEDAFFEDGEPVSLTFSDFLEMVLDLRGGQQATVQDIMRLGKRFTKKIMSVNGRITKLEGNLENLTGEQDAMSNKLDEILTYLKK